jgi:hypothetical protein
VNPNLLTASIEFEDVRGGGDVPETQFRAGVLAGRRVLQRYPQIRYLITHRAISPLTRARDPGPAWLASGRFAALARELGLEPIP